MPGKNLFSWFLTVYLCAFLAGSPVYAQESSGVRDVRSLVNQTERGVRSFGTPEKQPSSSGLTSLPLQTGGVGDIYYNVHILGEVATPGVYRILPSDRVTDALRYAGDVLPNGSQRLIQLRRQGQTSYLDLFSYKYRGNLNQNPYLMENDVIFIPIKKGEVRIEGPVNRPGFYEITRPIPLKDLVSLAGGFSLGLSSKEPIRIVRFNGEEKKEIIPIDSSADALKGTVVRPGDVIVVPHLLLSKKKFDYNVNRVPGDNIFYPTVNDNVYVIGAVLQPGAYAFQPSFDYQDYVSQAGPQNSASLRRAKLLKANGKKVVLKKSTEINPGDTIIVPTRAVTAANFITWFGTLTSMALTTFVFVDRFAK